MNAPLPTTEPRYKMVEIAGALGVSKQAAQNRANKEGWPAEKSGRGMAYPLATLPKPIRDALQKKAMTAALPVVAQEVAKPIVVKIAEADLTDRQRLERDARMGVRTAIARLMETAGCSQESALHTLINNARAGMLDGVTDKMLQLARDPRGRAGDGYPSVRTLKRWLSAADLAPKTRQKDMAAPGWATDFLHHWQQPQKPSVKEAYRQFCESAPATGRPSIHQVRRFLAKLGTITRERGRMGARELKNIQPFVRRDFSQLLPNDVWSADGHTFDAEVQHPLHGRPFRPEITTFVDIATRRAVGWSVDLAESAYAVADSLRYAVEHHGTPAIIYVDNGSGYKNAYMNGQAKRICSDLKSDAAIGVVGRMGATMLHSLPYNSQARGVIERLHQTLWVEGAKLLPSYMGKLMDREARLLQFKLTRKALKSGGAMPLMPWDIFVNWVEQRIVSYNEREHRSLKGLSPNMCWNSFEARGWEPETISTEELSTLFRPRVTRRLARAEIRLFNNIYFARELAEFHGMKVHVAYDIHDPQHVWVYHPDGQLLCTAEVNGNSKHYFPVPVVEQARQTRAKGRLNRVDAKRAEILEELHGGPAIAAPAADRVVIGGRVIEHDALDSVAVPVTPQTEPAPRRERLQDRAKQVAPEADRAERTPAEIYAEWRALDARIAAGETVTDSEARWHQRYQSTAQYRVESKKKAAA